MCGLAGVLLSGPRADGLSAGALAGCMTDGIRHRGPDDEGLWEDETLGLALGFRRLSIIDLSENGHQPMASADGRLVLTFNGEIYNFADVRAELEAEAPVVWRGHSDSEVLVEAFARWGVERTLARVDGMFALALWDRAARTLTFARDPFGEKPLYYGTWGDEFAWGSELAAFERLPGPAPALEPRAVALYLAHRYVPAPWSIRAGVFKLPPGGLLTLEIGDGGAPAHLARPERVRRYWSAPEAARAAAADPFAGDEGEAEETLDALISRIVAERLVADVPVGTFLSGGIDSSLVTAHATRLTPEVASFTIGFSDDPRFDESPHARAVAAHLGSRHRERQQTGADALALVPALPRIYAEPFADPSALPTALLCRFAREEVTVALTGDGGDEIFLGYTRYAELPAHAARAAARLAALRRATRIAACGLAPFSARRARRLRLTAETDLAVLLAERSTAWRDGLPLKEAAAGALGAAALFDAALPGDGFDPALELSLIDCGHALPDGLQVKVDRASMHVGMELRAPLLSRRIAEFAWRLPTAFKIGADGAGKRILRSCLARHVPRPLFERPKAGFEPPLGAWLRGPLKGWSEDLLGDRGLVDACGLDPASLAAVWRHHLRGKNRVGDLWPVLMLLAWQAERR